MLIGLVDTIEKNLDDDEIVCGGFNELMKAFDTVTHELSLKN